MGLPCERTYMDKTNIYKGLGIDEDVFRYGEGICDELSDRFARIDEVSEINQLKVIGAMQECRVSEACLGTTTGYGYNDIGRDTLEEVYAKVFHTEAALVRPLIACGTHALAIALFGNLRPGDELIEVTGTPYDTLQTVIGRDASNAANERTDHGLLSEESFKGTIRDYCLSVPRHRRASYLAQPYPV